MTDSDIILHQLNHYKSSVDRAIKITEQYVSEHKLILTGGMAIDLALRAKGQSLYSDDTLPDYDIISDKNLFHATALAEKLCKEGLPDINVINAIHITTVKVRIKKIVLLDATYIPTLCIEQIPYLDIEHLRVVHPNYQLIDQRLSLSHLMADTGISLNIFNRLSKDFKRNALLRSLYPIESSSSKQTTKKITIPLDLIQVKEMCIDQLDPNALVYTGPACISGYVGYVIMMALFNNTLNQLVITKDYLELSIPTQIPVRIISCDIDSLKPFISKKHSMYRPLLNIKPVSIRDKGFEYVDTYGSRIGCNIIDLSDNVKVCVASVDYLLMEMLRDRIYIDDEPYSSYYCELVNAVDQQQLDEKSSSIWWPSLNCYGIDNLPEYRVFMLEKLMDPDGTRNLKPKSSYPFPPNCFTKSEFVENDSHYFRIDGTEDNSLTHSNFRYIIQSFREYLDKKRNTNV